MKSRFAAALVAVGLLTISAAAQQRTPPNINGGLPYVSPDGQWISFLRERDGAAAQLFVIGPDGSREKQLTKAGGGIGQWMPDGKRLYFSISQGMAEKVELFTVGLDGAAPQPLVTVPGLGAMFSPDGKWIATSAGKMPNVHVTVLGRDATGARQLTEGSGMYFNAVFSPDGKRLAYARVDSTRNMQLWVMNSDGSAKRQLTNFSDADGHPQWPSWSPDGKRLAVQAGTYSQDRATNSAHIWLIDVASGAATKLAAHDRPYLDETPSFFPDGKRIALQSDRTGRMEIWVMNVDGTGARQVTR